MRQNFLGYHGIFMKSRLTESILFPQEITLFDIQCMELEARDTVVNKKVFIAT